MLALVIAVVVLLLLVLAGVWVAVFVWNIFWLKHQDRRTAAGKLPRKLSPRRGRRTKPARTRY